MSMAAEYLKKRVSVITADGRHYLGTLESCDQVLNVVLSSCVERIHSVEVGAEDMPLGVFLIRGSRIVCIGAVDTFEEATIDVRNLRGPPLPRVVV